MQRITLFGVDFDVVTLAEAEHQALKFVEIGTPHVIITGNPEMLEASRRDPDLLRAMREADLMVADGVGIVWASRYLNRPLPCRVPGIDLMERIVCGCARRGHSVYLLGARPGVAKACADRLVSKYPGLVVAGTMHGFFGADKEQEVIEEIKQRRPSVLFVGMGADREKWVAAQKQALGVPLMMRVGGSFDVIAGVSSRAPRWAQRANIEWLYRLLREPSRWRRQLALVSFVFHVLAERSQPIAPGRRDSAGQGATTTDRATDQNEHPQDDH